ncbi:MAG: hypothetical protein QUT30_04765 [Acidobacteriota bacterium]|nr:hypothetical protein [Acidobacteriota bacterium]
MKRKTLETLLFVAILVLGLAAWAPAEKNGDPRNPTLFEKRFQCKQLAASFPVDPDIARQWVPPAFELAIDPQTGKATGTLAVIYGSEYSAYSTPNNPAMEEAEDIAPDYVVHFWFALKGPVEILPVPGANATAPTSYYYDVADLVTNPVAHRLYRRAGRPAILIRNITFVDEGVKQTGEITFFNGSKITFDATTLPRATPLKLGGNAWQWHVGGLGEMGNDLGVSLDPDNGNPSNISTTKVQFLGLTPGNPNTTQTTIYADPGTHFEDVFGMNYVESLKGTFFQPNNIVLNASRGDLLWTTYPLPPIPVPPELP